MLPASNQIACVVHIFECLAQRWLKIHLTCSWTEAGKLRLHHLEYAFVELILFSCHGNIEHRYSSSIVVADQVKDL